MLKGRQVGLGRGASGIDEGDDAEDIGLRHRQHQPGTPVVDRTAGGSQQAYDLLPRSSLRVHQAMITGHLASGRPGVALHVHDKHGVTSQLMQDRGDSGLPAAGGDLGQAAVDLHAPGQGRDRLLKLGVQRGNLAEPLSLGHDSSWLAMTVPHNCARTDKRKVCWSDRSSLPFTTKKICSRENGEVMGNAHRAGGPCTSSRAAPVSPARSLLTLSGARSKYAPTCWGARLRRYGKGRSREPPW